MIGTPYALHALEDMLLEYSELQCPVHGGAPEQQDPLCIRDEAAWRPPGEYG